MNSYFKIITLLFLLFCSTLYANSGDKKIKLIGDIKDSAPKTITPKELEEQFKPFSAKVYNPWEKKEDKYTGVLLSEIVNKFANSSVTSITTKAIDDYSVTFDKKLIDKERILLAYKVNDKFIPIRKKGPLRIVFVDYDKTKKEYELNLSKWMWMINKIEFK